MKVKAFSLGLVLALVLSLVGIAFFPGVALAAGTIEVSPTSGNVDDKVYVDGSGFTAGTTIYIYFAEYHRADLDTLDDYNEAYEEVKGPVTVLSNGTFSTYFYVPGTLNDGYASATVTSGTYYVLAVGPGSADDILCYDTFRVGEGEISASPSRSLLGGTITVEGSDFDAGETVYLYFTSTALARGNAWNVNNILHCEYVDYDTTDTNGDCSFSFQIPRRTTDGSSDPRDVVAGTYYVVAVDGKSTGKVLAVDTVQVVIPVISLSPTSGAVGTSVTVIGKDFSASSTVTIYYDGASKGTLTSGSDGSFTFDKLIIPASSAGDHVIMARDARDYEDDATFKVTPALTVAPTQVNVGTQVTVSGSGFSSSQALTVKYDGTIVVSGVSTGSDGSFERSFNIPKSIHGAHAIIASDAGGATVQASVTMEATPPPVPTLISPENGSRVGFVGKATPTFEWSAVTDPSGVSYSLQIAGSEDFIAPVVSLTDLSATSYTLTEGQALSHGTYYWRVKAIDGAQNDSGWTAAYSFKSGLLPLWAFIVIIVLVVVLIGALVYLVKRKKREGI